MPRKPKDLTGQKFGNLTVKEYAGKVGDYPSWWCECGCGKIFTVPAYTLRRGDAVGCPFCQTHAPATSILWRGQLITVIPHSQYKNASIEYLGELVKQLTNNSDTNAVLVMLESTPSESLQNLESDLGGDSKRDYMDDSDDNWETIPMNPK